MRKIIIDCDPGHDDIIAIMVALAHIDELEIIGTTTVAGNQTLDKVTNNLLKVFDYLGLNYDVSMGCDKPIRRPLEVQPLAHGESGMDGPNLPETHRSVTGINAIDYLKDKLLNSTERLTIVAIGPLTNIGVLLKAYPEVKKHIEAITIMGGSLYTGNIIPKAEFNIYHDPEAAKIVFESGVPIIMSGLEVCYSGGIPHSAMEVFKHKGKASKLVYELLEYFTRYSKQRHIDWSPIFDMTPIIHLLKPEIFKSESFHVEIETEGRLCRGMTVADTRTEYDKKDLNTEVLMSVDNDEFVKYFINSILALDDMIK